MYFDFIMTLGELKDFINQWNARISPSTNTGRITDSTNITVTKTESNGTLTFHGDTEVQYNDLGNELIFL